MEAIQPKEALQPNIYQCGNTVHIDCKYELETEGQFKLIDPENVYINVYNYKYELQYRITQDQITREDLGRYSYGLIAPMEETVIIYEWVGEVEEGYSNKRGSFRTVFLDY